MSKQYAQLVGNYYNLGASYGERRSGEALFRFDFETDTLTIDVEGWPAKKYKLKSTQEEPHDADV